MSAKGRPGATRVATVETWQPEGRVERIVRKRRISATGNPATLIAAAARLVPEWLPKQATLFLGRRETSKGMFPQLEI